MNLNKLKRKKKLRNLIVIEILKKIVLIAAANL